MEKKEKFIQRITELISLDANFKSDETSCSRVAGEVYSGTLNLLATLYGIASPQVKAVQEANERIMKYGMNEGLKNEYLVQEMRGALNNLKTEIESGLIDSFILEAKGEILTDFLSLAKQVLNEGNKDVAAVLSCAAFEDSLKKYAEENGLDVQEADISQVINALKSGSFLQATQSKVMQSFVTLRNKSFHSEWEKIESVEVQSLIAFVQEFVLKNFTKI